MGIRSALEYVDFFIDLNMGKDVSLLSFVNNEKLVLKQKLQYKNLEKVGDGTDFLKPKEHDLMVRTINSLSTARIAIYCRETVYKLKGT